jgi:excisionase family DNA binding protein
MTANEVTPARETLTTGQAAQMLGISLPQVRRLCESGAIEFSWTSPGGVPLGTEVRGRELRGHRRLYRDSVEACREQMRGEAKSEA